MKKCYRSVRKTNNPVGKNGRKMSLRLSQESTQGLRVRQRQIKSSLKHNFPPNSGAGRGGLALLSAGDAGEEKWTLARCSWWGVGGHVGTSPSENTTGVLETHAPARNSSPRDTQRCAVCDGGENRDRWHPSSGSGIKTPQSKRTLHGNYESTRAMYTKTENPRTQNVRF